MVSASTPASQTLIVWSAEPETILVPSGEYVTDMTHLLCAFSLVALSSSVAAKHTEEASAQARLDRVAQPVDDATHLFVRRHAHAPFLSPSCPPRAPRA